MGNIDGFSIHPATCPSLFVDLALSADLNTTILLTIYDF